MAVVWPALASAATVVQLEARLKGIDLVVHVLAGRSSAPSPEKHPGNSLAYDEISRREPPPLLLPGEIACVHRVF